MYTTIAKYVTEFKRVCPTSVLSLSHCFFFPCRRTSADESYATIRRTCSVPSMTSANHELWVGITERDNVDGTMSHRSKLNDDIASSTNTRLSVASHEEQTQDILIDATKNSVQMLILQIIPARKRRTCRSGEWSESTERKFVCSFQSAAR